MSSAKQIADFLLTSQPYINANKKFKEASKISIISGKLTVLNKLGNKEIVIPKTVKGKSDPIETNILSHKLKGARADKQGLLKKLGHIDNNIASIGNLLENQKNLKFKKKWNKELEDIKTEELQQKIKNLMHEQHERFKLIEKREKNRLEKIELEEKIKIEEINRIEMAKKEEDKLKRLQETKEKAEERKKYMESIKELKNVKKRKLLHEQLEENFKKEILVPESIRITEAINVRHKSPVPSLEELQVHIKEYKKLMESKSNHRNSISVSDSRSFSPSKFWKILTEEEQLAKEIEKLKENEKFELIDRKKNYAKLVRQLYQPTVKENIIKVKPVPSKTRTLSLTPTLKESGSFKPISKPKKPSEIAKPKDFPKINYLEQRRELRQKAAENILDSYYSSFDLNSLEKVKKIEEKTKTAEIALKNWKSNEFNLAAEEKLNTMLIDSVKAKLDALKTGSN
jgi:hypothetical protein